MTDSSATQPTSAATGDPEVRVRANFYDGANPDHPAKSVTIGALPGIFIEPILGADGSVTFDTSVTDMSPPEAAEVLRRIAEEIDDAVQRDAINDLFA